MPTSISAGYAAFLDGGTYNGTLLRTFTEAAMTYNVGSTASNVARGGVLPGPSSLFVAAASGMTVTVQAGYCAIPAAVSTGGAYVFGLMSSGTLTVTASDPSNPRIDLVYAQVVDNGDSTSFAQVAIATGTAGPSPGVPSLPSVAIPLAQISVSAGASSIVSGDITDWRYWTAPPGAIIPVSSLSAVPQGCSGAYVHDRATNRLAYNPSSGPKQPTLLPFTTATAKRTSSLNVPASTVSLPVLSASVTTDGATDIAIHISWPGWTSSAATLVSQIFIDSTQVDGSNHAPSGGISTQGGSKTHYTSSTVGDTPSAGTHTIAWKVSNLNLSNAATLDAASTAPALLRVSAVPL